MAEKQLYVSLSIKRSGKGIPYGGFPKGETNPDGSAKNQGFKNLKGRPDRLAEVPELAENSGLYDLVAAISQPTNGLATVGCAGWGISDDNAFRWAGYIEFAFNSTELVGDAQNYFPLFFKFDQMLHGSNFDHPVSYHWELAGARFLDAGVDGFTCAVNVYTPPARSLREAKEAWQLALDPLEFFLGGYPERPGTPLFPIESD